MVVLHNNKTTQESPDAAALLSSLSGHHHSSHHHHHGRKGGALDFVLDDPALEDAVLRPLKTHNKKQRRVHFASENIYFKRSHALLHDFDFVQQTLWYSLDERASFKQAQKRTAKAVAQKCTTDAACFAVHALFHECLLKEDQQDGSTSTSTNASIHHTPEDRATLLRAFGRAYAGLESVASRTMFRDKHARRQRLYELVDELQEDDRVDANELAVECGALTRVAVDFAQRMAEMAMEEQEASRREEESDDDDDEQDEFAL